MEIILKQDIIGLVDAHDVTDVELLELLIDLFV